MIQAAPRSYRSQISTVVVPVHALPLFNISTSLTNVSSPRPYSIASS